MTRTHEQIGSWDPANRAAQVRAINGECDEILLTLPAQPCSGFSGYARPWKRRRIRKRNFDSFSDFELIYAAERTPDCVSLAQSEQKGDRRDSDNRGRNSSREDANVGEKFSTFFVRTNNATYLLSPTNKLSAEARKKFKGGYRR